MTDWADEKADEIIRHPEVSNHDRLVAEIAAALREERRHTRDVAFRLSSRIIFPPVIDRPRKGGERWFRLVSGHQTLNEGAAINVGWWLFMTEERILGVLEGMGYGRE